MNAKEALINSLKKEFKDKGLSVSTGEEMVETVKNDVMDTGLMSLNDILSGGMARGKVYEFFGPPASGKTFLALSIAAQEQALGGEIGFIDTEFSLNEKYLSSMNINTDKFTLIQSDSAEDICRAIEVMVRSGIYKIVIVDSVAALTPDAELNKGIDGNTVGQKAIVIERMVRFLLPILQRTKTTLIFINHLKVSLNPYGPKDVTPGGLAIPFYATARLKLKKTSDILDGEKVIGQESTVTVVKNKMGLAQRTTTIRMIGGRGWDKIHDLYSFLCLHPEHGFRKEGRYHYKTTNGSEELIASSERECLELLSDDKEYESWRSRLSSTPNFSSKEDCPVDSAKSGGEDQRRKKEPGRHGKKNQKQTDDSAA